MAVSPPSIFNDVIGPVMRGASSSHCAAALRIGRLALSMMGGKIDKLQLQLERRGALATTFDTQGSDMGLYGGLLGWDLTDERLLGFKQAMADSDIELEIEICDFPASSPNIYKLRLENADGSHELTADSTGGGMIEVLEIDGVPLNLAGDCHETLIFVEEDGRAVAQEMADAHLEHEVRLHDDGKLIELRGHTFLSAEQQAQWREKLPVRSWLELEQVLPVAWQRDLELPFQSCEEMLAYNEGKDLALWELAVAYESARGGLSGEEVFARMREIVLLLQNAVEIGLAGTEYEDRILGPQAPNFAAALQEEKLLELGALNEITLQISAMMEVKSSMGVIVAAPTAGACAALPGSVLGAGKTRGASVDDMTRAMLASGMIGTFIATHSTFAAEKAGCQAECGAGSGMAAAALVELAGGNLQQSIAAASMALQNMLGLICDPVAKRVEVPCLGRNVLGASNAVSCANMALSNFDAIIPLDEVITAMDSIGRSMPCEVRCTGLGGLAVTPTSQKLEAELAQRCCS